MIIPKIIHQTYFTKNLPQNIQENINFLIKNNPGWEYRFYDDNAIERFIKKNYHSTIQDAYNSIDTAYGAARADFFRYLLIYRTGGIYLDIKSSASAPLEQIVFPDDQYILSHWPNQKGEVFEDWGLHSGVRLISQNGEFQNWHVIARPEHPFLRNVISLVLRQIKVYTIK